MNEKQINPRDNNFGILRLLAAFMVIAGHNAVLTRTGIPYLFGYSVHGLGIRMFFVIGGFMITKSWLSDSSPRRYIIKRFLRIFPSLIVYVLLVVFVLGALMTTYSLKEYFSDPGTYSHLENIWLKINYGLPGVFLENYYQYAVNGSLWSLPTEVFNYFLIPLLLVIFRINKSKKRNQYVYAVVIGVLWILLQLARIQYFPNWSYYMGTVNIGPSLSLIPYYCMGSVLALPIAEKWFSPQWAMMLLLGYACFNTNEEIAVTFMLLEIIFVPLFSYFIISFGNMKPPAFSGITKGKEISYGMYLYGFPIQQTVICLFIRMQISTHPFVVLTISSILTIVVAFLNKLLIEDKMQKLTKKIT